MVGIRGALDAYDHLLSAMQPREIFSADNRFQRARPSGSEKIPTFSNFSPGSFASGPKSLMSAFGYKRTLG